MDEVLWGDVRPTRHKELGTSRRSSFIAGPLSIRRLIFDVMNLSMSATVRVGNMCMGRDIAVLCVQAFQSFQPWMGIGSSAAINMME